MNLNISTVHPITQFVDLGWVDFQFYFAHVNVILPELARQAHMEHLLLLHTINLSHFTARCAGSAARRSPTPGSRDTRIPARARRRARPGPQ